VDLNIVIAGRKSTDASDGDTLGMRRAGGISQERRTNCGSDAGITWAMRAESPASRPPMRSAPY